MWPFFCRSYSPCSLLCCVQSSTFIDAYLFSSWGSWRPSIMSSRHSSMSSSKYECSEAKTFKGAYCRVGSHHGMSDGLGVNSPRSSHHRCDEGLLWAPHPCIDPSFDTCMQDLHIYSTISLSQVSCPLLSSPIPSHPILSHPVLSRPIPSRPVPWTCFLSLLATIGWPLCANFQW